MPTLPVGPTDFEFNWSRNALLWQGQFSNCSMAEDFSFFLFELVLTHKIIDKELYLCHEILVKIKSENATINEHKMYGLWWSILNQEGCTSLVKKCNCGQWTSVFKSYLTWSA